jgi:hypothetical protein
MQLLPIVAQFGPLPIKVKFKSPVEGPAVLVATGTLAGTNANTLMEMMVYLDDNQIGATQLWTNQAQTHRTLPTLFLNVKLIYGEEHALSLVAVGNGVTADINDNFRAFLVY